MSRRPTLGAFEPHSVGARLRRRPRLSLALTGCLTTAGLVALAAPQASAATISCPAGGSGTITCEYSDTSAVGVFTVPAGVRKLVITLRGGEGGDGGETEESPGQGGPAGEIVRRSLNVSPGQVLHVLLGEGGQDVEACHGAIGQGGVTAGYAAAPRIAGGNGGPQGADFCAGGGGGGGSFVMRAGELPNEDTPLLAAGGGGGGGGAEESPNGDGGDGGRGGPGAQNGLPGVLGGEIGLGTAGKGQDADQEAGGGGGGGVPGGGAGGQGAGGAGGCGYPETVECEVSDSMSSTTTPATYRAASQSGQAIIEYAAPAPTGGPGNGQPPPAAPVDTDPHGSGHPSSNDPNPNTNPKSDPKPLPGMDANTDTALCKPEKKICTVGVSGPDSRFRIDAEDGKQTAVLFATMNGNYRPTSLEASGKPNCPDYAEQNSDWVQFGFTEPARGRTWHKTGYMTQRQKMKRAAATAMAQKLQICFAAPYGFPTRPGYRLGTQGPDRVGVLAECGSVRKTKGRPVPCVLTREIVKVKNGWTVRITFKIPANGKDPKALG